MSEIDWKEWYSSWIEPWRFYARLDEILIATSLHIPQITAEQIAFFNRMEELGLPLIEEKKKTIYNREEKEVEK